MTNSTCFAYQNKLNWLCPSTSTPPQPHFSPPITYRSQKSVLLFWDFSTTAFRFQYYWYSFSILLIFVFNTTDIEFQLYFIFHRQLVRRKVVETRKRVSTLWLWQVNVPKQRLAEPTSPQPGAYGIATLRWHSSHHGQKENGPWENAPAPTQNKRGSPLKTSPWYKSLSATYLAG